MKKPILTALSIVFLMTSFQSATALVKFGPETKTDIKGVKLSTTASIDDATPALNRITQGLRQKKVVFAWFSVYVAQVFTNVAKPDFSSVKKLKESVASGMPAVLTMTFVRDVDIGKIIEGFTDVCKKNDMDTTTAPVKDFLDAIQKNGDITDQQTIFFAFTQNAGKESLSVQTKGKEVFALKDQAPGTTTPFLNMWLGKSADSGLDQLQDQMLNPKDAK